MKPIRAVLLLLALLIPVLCRAGGPLRVGGPAYGKDGQPFLWNPASMPISYRVDPGPFAATRSGVQLIANATGLARVVAMFDVWHSVPTAAVSFVYAGPILPAGSYTGGDITTAQQFNDVIGSCKSGAQNPVIVDADGQLFTELGVSLAVIGFDQPCSFNSTTGYLAASAITLNGNLATNPGLTANDFDQAITHEIGHFLGLDHSQINLDAFTDRPVPCDVDSVAGMPLMFPVLFCQARKDVGLPVLAPDDVAWVSTFYPSASFPNSYAIVSGTIYFPDGLSQFQGANVIARSVDDANTPADESRRVAVSVVSGYRFTANPGQGITAVLPDPLEDNTHGDLTGSRNPQLIGYYEIALPPGTYTLEVEPVDSSFVSGSSIRPLDPPAVVAVPEFWNQDESPFDFPMQRDSFTVHAGDRISGKDIILNSPLFRPHTRFDGYEDSGMLRVVPTALPFGVGVEVLA